MAPKFELTTAYRLNEPLYPMTEPLVIGTTRRKVLWFEHADHTTAENWRSLAVARDPLHTLTIDTQQIAHTNSMIAIAIRATTTA